MPTTHDKKHDSARALVRPAPRLQRRASAGLPQFVGHNQWTTRFNGARPSSYGWLLLAFGHCGCRRCTRLAQRSPK